MCLPPSFFGKIPEQWVPKLWGLKPLKMLSPSTLPPCQITVGHFHLTLSNFTCKEVAMVTLPGGKAKHFHELDSYYKYSQDDSKSGTFIFLSSGWAELELCKNQPCTRQVWCPHEWSSKEPFVPRDRGFPLFLHTLRWSIAESKESRISAHVPVYGLDGTLFLFSLVFKGNYADENRGECLPSSCSSSVNCMNHPTMHFHQ